MIVKRRVEIWSGDMVWGWWRGENCHWKNFDVWSLFGIIPLYIREVAGSSTGYH